MADSAGALKDLMIITGFSGAGKSTAMNVFEDAGYFCVDNLPPGMIGSLIELFVHEGSKVERAAVVSDVRGGEYFDALAAVLDDLDAMRAARTACSSSTPRTRRCSTATRRRAAATRSRPAGSIAAGIAAERAQLDALKARADVVIDTTGLSAAMLRGKIVEAFLRQHPTTKLAVTFIELRLQARAAPRRRPPASTCGSCPTPTTSRTCARSPGAIRASSSSSTATASSPSSTRCSSRCSTTCSASTSPRASPTCVVAIGCTGGRHRSVAIAEHLAARYGAATTCWSR